MAAAGVAVIALLAGVLQTASATSLSQTEPALIATTTVLGSSSTDNTSVVGEQVTYTATVSSQNGAPTAGSVDFLEKDLDGIFQPITDCIDEPVDSTTGEATCPQTYDGIGTHAIRAEYSDDTLVFQESAAELTQTVKHLSSVTLNSDETEPPTVSGETVIYTASVAPSDTSITLPPTGTVTFQADGTDIPGCVSLDLAAGTPTCTTNFPVGDGDYVISAVYSGDSSFVSNTSNTVTQAVGVASTTTSLSSSPTAWKKDQPVKFTAGVAAVSPSNGIPAPEGTVTFKQGTTILCSEVLLEGGSADCTHTFPSTGSHEVKAEYSGDANYAPSDDTLTQVVGLPYTLTATGGSSNATFRISGTPRLPNYRLCVRYFGFGVEGNWPAVTPPPKQGSGIHRFGLNFDGKCKKQAWPSGANSDADQLMDSKLGSDDFGFATRGTYEVSWYTCGNGTCSTNGVLIGTDQFTYDSWCPPNVGGFRQMGTWRTSRHKVRDSCYTDAANAGGRDSHFDKDRSLSWKGWHPEFVARDWVSSYGAPSVGAIGASGNGWGNGWRRLTGVWVCDRYHHGKSEVHPIFVAEERTASGDIKRYIGGAQYSTKTPSISGTWRTYKC